jgi:hypothetical protein
VSPAASADPVTTIIPAIIPTVEAMVLSRTVAAVGTTGSVFAVVSRAVLGEERTIE